MKKMILILEKKIISVPKNNVIKSKICVYIYVFIKNLEIKRKIVKARGAENIMVKKLSYNKNHKKENSKNSLKI